MSKLKYQPYRAQEGRATLCLLLALAGGAVRRVSDAGDTKEDGAALRADAAQGRERMAEAERALYDYVRQNDIHD